MLTNPLATEIEVDSTTKDLWKAGAYVMLVLTVIQFMMIAYFGKKINIAAAIIQTSTPCKPACRGNRRADQDRRT